LKKRYRLDIRLITCVTDFRPHYFWTAPYVDRYMVAHDDTKKELSRRGVDSSIITVTGIPVAAKFFEPQDAAAIRNTYGLSPSKPVVLIIGGGFGVGPIEKLFEQFKEKTFCEVLIVCGRNALLSRILAQKAAACGAAHIHVYGFITTMHELMYIARVIITKPGGLTLQEALVLKKPVVGIEPIPGQERRNVTFLAKRGLCVFAHSVQEAVSVASALISDAARADRMIARINDSIRGKSSLDVIKIVKEQYAR
jgi:processive 1,2-diacylglycerol beta-glucosyltransferase